VLFLIIDIGLFLWFNGRNTNTSEENTKKMTNPIVLFETTKGDIKIELFEDKMPITAGNFRKLVEEGFYDGTKFHRVIDGFMVQGGDPLSKNDSLINRWGMGGSENIQDEFVKDPKLTNIKGTIAMANTGRPNSGSSQFFINVANNTNLDFDKAPLSSKHPVFGKVIEGMDIVIEISKVVTVGSDRPAEHIIIEKASIIE
ncbi:MAG: peptidylprolyl isomerase, partial [Nanoarchaeota archaeon]